MKAIKISICALVICLLSQSIIMGDSVKTTSIFKRDINENATFKLGIKLNKDFYKYKIKIKFLKANGEALSDKFIIKTDKKSFVTKTYSYRDIGFNTKVDIKLKKYKSLIINTYKDTNENKINTILPTNNDVLDFVINDNTQNQVDEGVVSKTPQYKTSIKKETITKSTLTQQEALINFKNNESNNIYSQALRTTPGYMDCSSFVCSAYSSIGVNFGQYIGNTETILHYAEKNAKKVKLNSLQVGDVLLYFDKGTKTYKKHYKHVTHVSMYIGNGQIYEYSGTGVNGRARTIGYYEKVAKAKAFRILK